jgi:hypothetical protein
MTNTNRPQQLISTGTRFAAALMVAGFVSAVCAAAGHESRHAVDESSAAMSRGTIYVQLPTVEVVARREAASAVAASNVHHGAAAL